MTSQASILCKLILQFSRSILTLFQYSQEIQHESTYMIQRSESQLSALYLGLI